jgi:peptide deformylase
MKLKIETGKTNQVLRSVSTPVKQEELKQHLPIAKEMLKWLKAKSNGAGLAAPQVGLNKRIIVVNTYHEDPEDGELHIERTLMMINPVILVKSEECSLDEEGCFSEPGIYGQVSRSNWIEVEFRDDRFLLKKLKLNDFSARVVQHEIDHLDGVLFTDKLVGEEIVSEE